MAIDRLKREKTIQGTESIIIIGCRLLSNKFERRFCNNIWCCWMALLTADRAVRVQLVQSVLLRMSHWAGDRTRRILCHHHLIMSCWRLNLFANLDLVGCASKRIRDDWIIIIIRQCIGCCSENLIFHSIIARAERFCLDQFSRLVFFHSIEPDALKNKWRDQQKQSEPPKQIQKPTRFVKYNKFAALLSIITGCQQPIK